MRNKGYPILDSAMVSLPGANTPSRPKGKGLITTPHNHRRQEQSDRYITGNNGGVYSEGRGSLNRSVEHLHGQHHVQTNNNNLINNRYESQS